MRKPGKIITILFNAAIFIILEVAALGMLRSGKAQDFFITKGAHAFMAKVWGGSESVKYYFSLKQANEQLAAMSGNNTFRVGFNNLAVSAMKCTPQKTMMGASVRCASCAKARLSPT